MNDTALGKELDRAEEEMTAEVAENCAIAEVLNQGHHEGTLLWIVMERMQGEIAGQLRILLGEAAYDQRIFTPTEKARRIKAMQECAQDHTSDETRHDSWMKMHIDSGWVYGVHFDPATKTHPNLVSWAELPASAEVKAKIFEIVSKTAYALAY